MKGIYDQERWRVRVHVAVTLIEKTSRIINIIFEINRKAILGIKNDKRNVERILHDFKTIILYIDSSHLRIGWSKIKMVQHNQLLPWLNESKYA